MGAKTMIANIRDAWERADAYRLSGALWYLETHKLALSLHTKVQVGAGLLAAFSPITPWSVTQELARSFVGGDRVHTLKLARSKARRILKTGDWRGILGGKKSLAFAEAIESAGESRPVVIDRHSGAVATRLTDPRVFRHKLYDDIEKAYWTVADDLGVRASVLQATTWLYWREHGSTKEGV